MQSKKQSFHTNLGKWQSSNSASNLLKGLWIMLRGLESLHDWSIFSILPHAFSKLSRKVASKFGSSKISFSSRCLLAGISSSFSKSNSSSEREAVDNVSLTDNRDGVFSHVSFILEKFCLSMAVLINVRRPFSSYSLFEVILYVRSIYIAYKSTSLFISFTSCATKML